MLIGSLNKCKVLSNQYLLNLSSFSFRHLHIVIQTACQVGRHSHWKLKELGRHCWLPIQFPVYLFSNTTLILFRAVIFPIKTAAKDRQMEQSGPWRCELMLPTELLEKLFIRLWRSLFALCRSSSSCLKHWCKARGRAVSCSHEVTSKRAKTTCPKDWTERRCHYTGPGLSAPGLFHDKK